jgi:hypothetical protein
MATVTIFKNINDVSNPHYVTISKIVDRIRTGISKITIEKIRSTENKDERNKIKKLLPAIIFSGKFSKRSIDGFIESSCMMSIDFDDFESTESLNEKRFELEFDEFTHILFLSPSGDGLKVIVKIPNDPLNYKQYFDALKNHYNCKEFDVKCSDISRVCYESYDPNIFFSENSSVWNQKVEAPKIENRIVNIPQSNQNKIIKGLTSWWTKNYGMTHGQKNSNLYILASTLNSFGIDKADALDELLKFDEGGKDDEISSICNSAYNRTENFGTKVFEDLDKVDEIMKLASAGYSIESIKKFVPGVTAEAIEAVSKKATIGTEFWSFSSRGVVSIINLKYRDFLSANGFYKLYLSKSNHYVLIRIIDNIIMDVTDEMVKSFTLDYLETLEDSAVWNFYADKTRLHKEDFLSFLPKADPEFMKDNEETAYIYYNNCCVRVTKDSVDTIEYKDIDGCVWERQKIDRDFCVSGDEDSEFKRFIYNISGKDSKRFESVESTVGFLLHSYKPSDFCPAVILNDETISEDPEGGTGKGIFVKGIGCIKKNVIIEGKSFNFQKSFLYQRVSADTQTLTYDDVQKGFEFERLFSIITEGITLEKKNKDEIKLDFEDSPKVIITTNYAIKGSGNSFDRRKWELEFAQHYNKNYTPKEEFGHQLFGGWSKEEWCKFDNYMIHCLQLYLSNGLTESPFKNLELRKLEAASSYEFREWVTAPDKDRKYRLYVGVEYLGSDLMNDFTSEYPDYGASGKIKLSHKTFYKWLNSYAKFKFGEPLTTIRSTYGLMVKFTEQNKQTKINYV